MAISHLEDLPLDTFLKVVQNIASFHASEKLDGANLWMGLNEKGKLFTTREGKSKRAKRYETESEYPNFAAYNGFRSAHAALEAKYEDIRRVMQPGQMVEIEVLYGRQPNAVTYGAEGKSFIAFLRGVNGTPDVIADQLSMALGGQSVTVDVQIVTTPDGEKLESANEKVTYQFTGAQKIDPSKLKDVDLTRQVNKLLKYLEQPSGINDLTNGQLVKTSLGTIKEPQREAAKTKKAEVIGKIMADYRIPIKQDLLKNYVRKIKPALADSELTDSEDLGIEGVVLRDPDTSDLVKLVDKDAFTTINAFNHAIRNQISNVIKTTDPDAPLEARGGVVGDMRIRIADLLGNSDLARGATAKRAFEKVRGADAKSTIKAFTANLTVDDFIGTKKKLLAIIKQAVANLKNLLDDFKETKDEFRLKLKNGKTIGITPEIEKRTYLVFAESIKNVVDLHNKIVKARTIAQVVATLYGHLAKQVHEVKPEIDPNKIEEALALFEKKYDTDKARYRNKDAFQLLNIYFATTFLATMMYMADDERGIKMLKDKTHYRMTAWSKDMSALNFWGYPIWRSSSPAVKKLIGIKVAQDLFRVVRRVPPSGSRYLHMDLSFGKDVPIEWQDHVKTLRILQQFDGMNTDRINILIDGVFTYDTSPRDKQVKTLARLFYYANQFIPTSPLLTRLKSISDEKLLNANGENDLLVPEMKLLSDIVKLVENDPSTSLSGLGPVGDPQGAGTPSPSFDTAGSSGNPGNSQLATATKAADANVTPGDAKKKGNVIRRKRNPDIRKMKFPKPEDSTV